MFPRSNRSKKSAPVAFAQRSQVKITKAETKKRRPRFSAGFSLFAWLLFVFGCSQSLRLFAPSRALSHIISAV